MRYVLCLRHVCHDFLLDALLRHLLFLVNFTAFFDVAKYLFVLLYSFATRTREEQHFEYLLHIAVQLLRPDLAPAALNGTLPPQLHFDAVVTEELVALWTLHRVRLCYEPAQLANELINRTRHPCRFVDIER